MVGYRATSCALALAFGAVLQASADEGVKTFVVYTDKFLLQPGQVHNAWVKPKPLPVDIATAFANKTLHLQGVALDIVRVDGATGEERSLPLSEVYNHHHALLVGEAKALEAVYNRSRGRDPLGPHKHDVPSGKKMKHRGLRRRGCMMHGASVKDFLGEIAEVGAGGKVASFGGASGAEFRGTPTDLAAPFVSAAFNPQSFMALIHFINMRGAPDPHMGRFQCPCTKARKFNLTNGTIDGELPVPFECSAELIREKNPSCSLATYVSGYRCCEDGVFLSEDIPGPDVPADEIQAKFTFKYYEDLPEAIAVRTPTCCDATGNITHKGNLEYDVPQCEPGTPCEHMITSVQPLDLFSHGDNGTAPPDPDELMDLVHAWGHQHVGALGMELYNEQTGELLCRTQPKYGAGTAAGDEAGFVVAIPPCVWGPPPLPAPPRLRRGDLLRTVARYDSRVARRGVMALWLMDAAPVADRSKLRKEVLV